MARKTTDVTIKPPEYLHIRVISPGALFALLDGGNTVEHGIITLSGTVPYGLIERLVDDGSEPYHVLRLETETKFENEWNNRAIGWSDNAQWLPCPFRRCRRALTQCESVDEVLHRVCTHGHRVRLSNDGRNAHVIPER